MDWYVVRTAKNSERRVRDNILRLNKPCYLPLIGRDRRSGRRYGTAAELEPMFPGYLFVSLVEGIDNFHQFRSVPGAHGLIRFGESTPAKLPNGFVECLQSDAVELAIAKNFAQGDEVRVKHGAMHDLIGIIDERKGEDRVRLLMNVMGQQTRVEVDVREIEPI